MDVILPAKGDVFTVKSQESVIGDGDPMRISAEVAEHLHRTAESRLGVHYPILSVQPPQKLMELFRIGRSGSWPGTAEPFPAIEALQTGAELATEHAAKDLHWQKERIVWTYPMAVVCR
jgi:hypothetical protein